MRVLAEIRAASNFEGDALDDIRARLADAGLISVDDYGERSDVIDELVHDMSPDDRRQFQRTVRHVAKDPVSGAIASISVLTDRYFLLRVRHVALQRLLPTSHEVLTTLMSEHGPTATANYELRRAEVRERATDQAFLFGAWRGGQTSFLRYLFSQRRANFIAGLFIIGLVLEVALTLLDLTSTLADLGLRLGAPMLVSSLVLILERRAQFRDQLQPRLWWTSTPTGASHERGEAPQVAPVLDPG